MGKQETVTECRRASDYVFGINVIRESDRPVN